MDEVIVRITDSITKILKPPQWRLSGDDKTLLVDIRILLDRLLEPDSTVLSTIKKTDG
jgi:hypothetical protein